MFPDPCLDVPWTPCCLAHFSLDDGEGFRIEVGQIMLSEGEIPLEKNQSMVIATIDGGKHCGRAYCFQAEDGTPDLPNELGRLVCSGEERLMIACLFV